MTSDEAERLTAIPQRAVDLAWPSRPLRALRLAPTAQPIVLVETTCARPRVVDRIEMRAHDAELRLSPYYALAQER